ncbi:hypothetical protein [Herbaspirillum sp. CAH-3]|uniref:hypothetical protein n=1 Tax=Herbaspirillum sp. CAH-3 TaxID=2605746 RepID=UPI0012AC848F|nr:hypothetical protein [Herbaspirillum sp. CAH-3]MRT27624.1 hypothetical protein [Herbaspirillum sp. CAH-3]
MTNDRLTDKQLDAYCEEWLRWCDTRKFYFKPGAQNVLARFQAGKSKEPPDARNSADMQWFNAAVYAMADMKEHEETFACFRLMYIERAGHVKRLADERGISQKTYYNRARTFVRKAMSLARSFQVAQQSFDAENRVASV